MMDVLSGRKRWCIECIDAIGGLSKLPDNCIHCVVTSPPYWRLRTYEVDTDMGNNVIGGEKTLDCMSWATHDDMYHSCYVCHVRSVFLEVRRVLRQDGVLFLNIGDSYDENGNLCGAPWHVAEAMKKDGWILRSSIIYSKTSPLPEATKGWRWEILRGSTEAILHRDRWRPTRSHEYIFMFTGNGTYFCDREAIVEPYAKSNRVLRLGPRKYETGSFLGDKNDKHKLPIHGKTHESQPGFGRNPKTVWEMASDALTSSGHYATFPMELPMRCIAVATSRACSLCGMQEARVLRRVRTHAETVLDPAKAIKSIDVVVPHYSILTGELARQRIDTITPQYEFLGFMPTCQCGAPMVGSVVLDPFVGSGTTVVQALRMGRRAIGFDISRKYVEIAKRRIIGDGTLTNYVVQNADLVSR